MFTLFLASMLAAPPEAATHEANNPLFKSLLEDGLAVGGKDKVKFPAPTMPDGLDGPKQKAIINALIADDYKFDNFTDKSVVAPQLIKLRDEKGGDPNAPARGVDVWFVVYGDVKSLDDDKFLDRVMNSGRGNGQAKGLTAADLMKRKIVVADPKKEGFGHLEFDFLEKVHLRATGRSMWTRTADSVVVAGEIDPRFAGDPDFPNQWQSIIKGGAAPNFGPANPWAGAAFYLKITKLAEPTEALFCEQHVIFVEPQGWFAGANLLRSKLPAAVQINVRNMRKEWAKIEK
ncbi:MAG: hypothetical protein C0467_22860 [Planctomycetaceae bacterium]|nr:hypothetical protein [Planctomycetaceae bacterium]